MVKRKTPLVVIVGQTASGKSDLAVRLAKHFGGEVISADSRQIYKEFNLTSGKITKDEMQGAPHHLLDVLSAKDGAFDAVKFATLAAQKVKDISACGKIPIIAGGTGFYIDVLLGRVKLDNVSADKTLRKKLESKSADELKEELNKLNPIALKKIDTQNKQKLIRRIELELHKEGKEKMQFLDTDKYNVLWIGIAWDKETLRERIYKRLIERYKQGMCREAQVAHELGASWDFLESLGLEVKYCAKLIKSELSEEEFIETLFHKTWQYAKRQKTYWRRNENIRWFHPSEHEKIYTYTKKQLYSNYDHCLYSLRIYCPGRARPHQCFW